MLLQKIHFQCYVAIDHFEESEYFREIKKQKENV